MMEDPSIEELLKRASGEFCLESIFILDFSCRGIFSLGSIPKCLNLCMLDLSSNHLSSIGGLAILTALEQLDLSDNNISQLDGLEKLENLSRLELAGNEISSFNTLLPLSSLCKLKHLTLQLPSPPSPPSPSSKHGHCTKLSNPVCRDPVYAIKMSEIFPTLVWLDKEVVRDGEAGKTFYSDSKAILQESANASGGYGGNGEDHVKKASNLPALVDPWQGIDDQVDAKSEEKIRRLLAECSDTSSKVQKLLHDVKSELVQ